MRVVYFSQDYTPHDHRFLEALAGTDNEVHFLRLEDRELGLETRPIPTGIQIVNWWGGRDAVSEPDYPVAIDQIRAVFDRLEPDVVHAGPVQGPAYLTAMAGYRPLVTMSWGSDLLMGTRSEQGRRAARLAISGSEVVVTDSQIVTDKAIEMGADPDRIVMFPWGVDLGRYRPGTNEDLRHQLGWDRALILISTRSWEPIYGVSELIEGFVESAGQLPHLRMLMLGGGSLEERIKHKLVDSGLETRVLFPGQVLNSDLPSYYRAADLYVTASRSDGSSISLLEAMACGLPVVASDIPGNTEWVEPEQSGWLFEDGNSRNLATCLLTAASRVGEFKQLGRRGREVVEERADWSRNFPKLLKAYRMAMPAWI